MKKVWVSLFAITLSLGVFAQDSTNQTNTTPQQNVKSHDGVIMKDGKLLMMKNGQTTQLTTDLTLDNGAVVKADGTVQAKDGTTTTLKEGDYVAMDGTIGNVKNKWQQKDKMRSDSLK
jgi:surface antigen